MEATAHATEVFDEVHAAHYVPLVRLAYLTTGSMPAAEDVVQDVFVEWLRRLDHVAVPVPYLRRAVVSRCTSWIRRRPRLPAWGAPLLAAAAVFAVLGLVVVRPSLEPTVPQPGRPSGTAALPRAGRRAVHPDREGVRRTARSGRGAVPPGLAGQLVGWWWRRRAG